MFVRIKKFLALPFLLLIALAISSDLVGCKSTNEVAPTPVGVETANYYDSPIGDIFIPVGKKESLEKICKIYGIPTSVMARLIYAEDKWQNRANGDDEGYCQLNRHNRAEFTEKYNKGKPFDPYNFEEALAISCAYLCDLYKQTGDYRLATASYNCGLSRVRRGEIPSITINYLGRIFGREVTKEELLEVLRNNE